MQKLLGLFFIFFILVGCSKKYYVLSTASDPSGHYTLSSKSIGVEKVIVPKYLFKREIAISKSSSQIEFLSNAVWAENLEDGLTQRLIGFLQKKFQNPNIHAYPWGVEKQPTSKVRVVITRFIAQGEYIYLSASWDVFNFKLGTSKARLFSTTVPLDDKSTDAIVSAMNKAFGKLEEAVAEGLN